MKIRVYYEDTDSLGVVYHANYLKYIERARSEAFFAIGRKPESAENYFVVRSMSVRFVKSAKLGDLLEVRSRLTELRAASFRLKQELWLDNALVFSADVEIASVRAAKPAKIDDETKKLLNEVFAG
ncbi:MAG: YbgC/FadM family acyl-CoA thioesterase [Helicobacteraceae bacterium]|jgi:acyl-CoA thioester hydrolase|nr:YbgC/FadM family acyl-CoA thioesterase [Helicobacteraceae bacterium]